MKFEIYYFGHHEFEKTGMILKAVDISDALNQLRWIYPNCRKNRGIDIREVV